MGTDEHCSPLHSLQGTGVPFRHTKSAFLITSFLNCRPLPGGAASKGRKLYRLRPLLAVNYNLKRMLFMPNLNRKTLLRALCLTAAGSALFASLHVGSTSAYFTSTATVQVADIQAGTWSNNAGQSDAPEAASPGLRGGATRGPAPNRPGVGFFCLGKS